MDLSEAWMGAWMRRASLQHAWAAICLFAILAGSGCASVKPTQSGYLSDYTHLHPAKAWLNWGTGYHRYSVREPVATDLAGVDSFYIEPIAWLVPEDDWLANDKTRKERVTKAFDQSLRDRFGEIRPIVCAPGPNSARVKAAVTGVSSARTLTNIAASVVFGPISNGGASVEVEVLNPAGAQVAALSGASHGGGLDMVGYYFRSGHAKQAVKRLSGDIARPVIAATAPVETVTR
jgi:hypothetical protein